MGGLIFTVIPALPSFRLYRHPGFTDIPVSVIPIFPVIPAKAGIYALRWTPVSAAMTDPHPNRLNRTTATAPTAFPIRWCDFPAIPIFPPFQSFRHSSLSVIPSLPSPRLSRHSGESRNLRPAMDSGFRRNDGSTPKPPEPNHPPAPAAFPIGRFHFRASRRQPGSKPAFRITACAGNTARPPNPKSRQNSAAIAVDKR